MDTSKTAEQKAYKNMILFLNLMIFFPLVSILVMKVDYLNIVVQEWVGLQIFLTLSSLGTWFLLAMFACISFGDYRKLRYSRKVTSKLVEQLNSIDSGEET